MTNVLITHPGLQHSHQFALALYEAGMLGKYISGVPVAYDSNEWDWLPDNVRNKIKQVPVATKFRKHPFYWQLILRLGTKIGSDGFRHDFAHRVFHWFDDSMAKEVLRIKPSVVVCFENSAARTFAAAKSIGAKCILDAPSIHYKAAEDLIGFSTSGYLEKINRRKDKELDLADAVITCSQFAADTYIAAGIDREKIKPLLLGAALPEGVSRTEKDGPIRFIFAGAMSERKSIDLILSVFSKLAMEGANAILTIVGGTESQRWVEQASGMDNVNYIGAVSQKDLYNYFASSDCLLLPSRFDAFGMVVAEAMAVGVPAIVSETTGARAMIEKFPGSGWVVKAEEDEIHDLVKRIVNEEVDLKIASNVALKASEFFTWQAYRKRVVRIVREVQGD